MALMDRQEELEKERIERRVAKILTDETLAHRLLMIADAPRTFTFYEKKALLFEAAKRIRGDRDGS